jgi:hypothetical protein
MPETTSSTPVRRSSAGRIAALVTGVVVGLVAFGLLAAGGVLLWGNAQKDKDGYVSTKSERFHTKTYAISTENLDVNTDGPDWLVSPEHYGKVRLAAHSRAGKPVFVGIARTADVDAYLRASAHATVTDVDYPSFHASYRTAGGDRRPAAPAAQRFWTASAHGAGSQTVTWDVKRGSWSIVVMNADGTPNVDAGVKAGAEAPWLSAVGWGTLGGGLLLLAVAGGLVFAGVRTPRAERGTVGPVPAVA